MSFSNGGIRLAKMEHQLGVGRPCRLLCIPSAMPQDPLIRHFRTPAWGSPLQREERSGASGIFGEWRVRKHDRVGLRWESRHLKGRAAPADIRPWRCPVRIVAGASTRPAQGPGSREMSGVGGEARLRCGFLGPKGWRAPPPYPSGHPRGTAWRRTSGFAPLPCHCSILSTRPPSVPPAQPGETGRESASQGGPVLQGAAAP